MSLIDAVLKRAVGAIVWVGNGHLIVGYGGPLGEVLRGCANAGKQAILEIPVGVDPPIMEV